MELFKFRQGTQPLLLSMPHVGTHLPDLLARRMMPIARTVPDTDWHLEQLYDFADALGASPHDQVPCESRRTFEAGT